MRRALKVKECRLFVEGMWQKAKGLRLKERSTVRRKVWWCVSVKSFHDVEREAVVDKMLWG